MKKRTKPDAAVRIAQAHGTRCYKPGLITAIRRAIRAAVRKERERCMKIIADDFGTLNPGRVSVTIAKIRSGT